MERILVLGCGSIGQRHLRNAAVLGIRERSGFDPDPARRLEAENTGARAYDSLEAALSSKPDAVFVCTPPVSHIALALRALEVGAHVFIEKPLSHSLEGTAQLLQRTAVTGRLCMVGYNLRFHAGVARLLDLATGGAVGEVIAVRGEFGHYLPDWRPGRDYRQGYNARSELGGGVLLDVSHEIDYLRMLVAEIDHVFCYARNTGHLEIDTEDLAALVMRSPSGVLVELHLDCLQRSYSRGCKVIGTEGTIIWDYSRGLDIYMAKGQTWRHEPFAMDPNLMYLRQLEHFVACARGEGTPRVDASTGRRVLEIVEAARRSARSGTEVPV